MGAWIKVTEDTPDIQIGVACEVASPSPEFLQGSRERL
jgi:hypothetical protein